MRMLVTRPGALTAALISLIVGLFISASVWAVDPLVFEDTQEAERHQELSEELRCLVCQNQSLADSDAPLAQDLRREVLELMRQGMDNQEIRDYLVSRYTNFVLYRPPLDLTTFLLWFGPLLLVAIALFVLYRAIRRQQQLQQNDSADAANTESDTA